MIKSMHMKKRCLALGAALLLAACAGTPSLPMMAAKLETVLVGAEVFHSAAPSALDMTMPLASPDMVLTVRSSVYGHRRLVEGGVLSSIVKPAMVSLRIKRLCVGCAISGHPVIMQKHQAIAASDAYLSQHCTPEYLSFEKRQPVSLDSLHVDRQPDASDDICLKIAFKEPVDIAEFALTGLILERPEGRTAPLVFRFAVSAAVF